VVTHHGFVTHVTVAIKVEVEVNLPAIRNFFLMKCLYFQSFQSPLGRWI